MFERFTQNARRIIFFARYEAAHAGSDYIEPVHLLMGLLREDRKFTPMFFDRRYTSEQLRLALEASLDKKAPSGAVDLPLAYESKKYISQAVNLADTMRHRNIEPKHFLLAFLSVPDGEFIQKLAECGVRLEDVMGRVQEETVDTDFVSIERLPFHASVVQWIIEAGTSEELWNIGRYLTRTIVPEGHDKIIAAWRAKGAVFGWNERELESVEYDLLIQKQAAAEKAAAQSE